MLPRAPRQVAMPMAAAIGRRAGTGCSAPPRPGTPSAATARPGRRNAPPVRRRTRRPHRRAGRRPGVLPVSRGHSPVLGTGSAGPVPLPGHAAPASVADPRRSANRASRHGAGRHPGDRAGSRRHLGCDAVADVVQQVREPFLQRGSSSDRRRADSSLSVQRLAR